MFGSGSLRDVTPRFNVRHLDYPFTHNAISMLVEKIKETGSVHNKPHLGWPHTATDAETSENMLAAFAKSPLKSTVGCHTKWASIKAALCGSCTTINGTHT
jgi:hypothetical protein